MEEYKKQKRNEVDLMSAVAEKKSQEGRQKNRRRLK